MNKIILSIPIFIILIISIFLFIFLLQEKNPTKPPSALLNEELPKFSLVSLFDKTVTLSSLDVVNQITLINFFASWCAPCKVEHPLFFKIKKNIQIYLFWELTCKTQIKMP